MNKLLLCVALSAVSTMSFAAYPDALDTQCPPVKALHHVRGEAWTLDQPYNTQGWYTVQSPDVNWMDKSFLPGNTKLVAYWTDENYGVYPYYVSCSYQYGQEDHESVIVKSVYPVMEGTMVGFENHVCKTIGDKSEACKWQIRDVSVKR